MDFINKPALERGLFFSFALFSFFCNLFAADYTPLRTVSVSTTSRVSISTRRDTTVERNETFVVSIPLELMQDSPAAADCITRVDVLIINDDCKLLSYAYSSLNSPYYFSYICGLRKLILSMPIYILCCIPLILYVLYEICKLYSLENVIP